MNEKFTSLDSIVEEIRTECEARVRQAETERDKALIEARLCHDEMVRARDDKAYAEQVATRLIAHFDIAEQAFGKAREFALTIPAPAKRTEVPNNTYTESKNGSIEADVGRLAQETTSASA